MDARPTPPDDEAFRPGGIVGGESTEARLEATQALVGRLARRLVRDPARADDVAQRTMLAMLARPMHGVRSPVAWLSGSPATS